MKTLFKFIIGIPVITTLIIAIIFLGVGVYESALGIMSILKGELHTETTPGIVLFQVLDIFLIGLLFLIFSIGFSQLFFPNRTIIAKNLDHITPEWLKVENFTELKLILWDTALTTLVILFIGDVYRSGGQYEWQLAILPLAILFISLAKYLIKKSKKAL